MRKWFAAVAMAGFCPNAPAATRLDVTADNSIVNYPGEEHLNAGRQRRIRIKCNQHLVALKFDTRALRGKRVRAATLVCQRADKTIDEVTISTIAVPWDEHKSNVLTSGAQDFPGWGWPGGRFPTVMGSNSFTLVSQAKSVLRDGAYHWEVDPDLIHANAIGAAFGLAIHEVSNDYLRNPTIWSREQTAKRPYLLVRLDGKTSRPLPPRDLRLVHSGDWESLRLELTGPAKGFAYQIQIDGEPMPRWCIPFVERGKRQFIPLRDQDLTGKERVRIAVCTLSRTGKQSRPAMLDAVVPEPRTLSLPEVEPVAAGTKDAALAVIPPLDKYDIDGKPIGDLPTDYRWRNEVFDGRAISLSAARGEAVGFQMLLKGTGSVSVQCELGGLRTDLYRAVYVKSKQGAIPDPLVPFETVDLSPSQATPVVVDVFVPFDLQSRTVAGIVRVSDGRSVPIQLKVHDFALPRKASFLCEMNSYGVPNRLSEFYRLQEIAYDHRAHCNILYYNHRSAAPGARKCVLDMILDLGPDATGRRMAERRFNDIKPGSETTYWDDFVQAFGAYLSGEHFRDGHRGAIPAPGFYLMFHESWPLNVRAYFDGDPDAYRAFKSKPEYARTFVSLMRDFIRLADKEGWRETGFQVYLNNKGKLDDLTRNPWVLDEPASYWDYRALAFYSDLVRQAKGDSCPTQLDFRIDISRPHFDRGQLRGKIDLWVVANGAMRGHSRLVRDRAERSGFRYWVYGTTNAVEDSNRATQAWVLESFRLGACGVVPWQTVDKKGNAMRKANQLGLFIFDRTNDGRTVIRHSLRLKAYRRAQQDVEYLTLLRDRLRLTPAQMRQFIDHYVQLDGRTRVRYAEDAGTAQYRRLSPEAFRRLRVAAARMLGQ